MKKCLSISLLILTFLASSIGSGILAATDTPASLTDTTDSADPTTVSPVETNKRVRPVQLDKKITRDYQNIKDAYLKTVDTYKRGHQDFVRAKQGASRLSSAENREKLLDKAKEHLKNSISVIIKHLEVLKQRVENIPGMDEDVKTNLIAEIDSDIVFLQQQQDGIDDISSLEEIKEFGKTVREYWHKVRARDRKIVGHILAARFRHFIDRLKTLSQRLKEESDKLKAAGIDTSEVDALLADFDEKIALAEGKYKEAVEVFQSISNIDQAQELFKKGHDLIKEGHSYLKQAHEDLRQAVSKLKELKVSNTENPSDLE